LATRYKHSFRNGNRIILLNEIDLFNSCIGQHGFVEMAYAKELLVKLDNGYRLLVEPFNLEFEDKAMKQQKLSMVMPDEEQDTSTDVVFFYSCDKSAV